MYRATLDAMQRYALWSGQVTLKGGGTLNEPSYVPNPRKNGLPPGVLGPEDLQAHFDFMLANYGKPRFVGGALIGPSVTVG